MSTSQKKKTRASRRKNEDHQKHAGTQSNSNNSYSSQDDSEQESWDNFQQNYLNASLFDDQNQGYGNERQNKQHTTDCSPIFRICSAVYNFSDIPADKEVNCSNGSSWCPLNQITTEQISLALTLDDGHDLENDNCIIAMAAKWSLSRQSDEYNNKNSNNTDQERHAPDKENIMAPKNGSKSEDPNQDIPIRFLDYQSGFHKQVSSYSYRDADKSKNHNQDN